MHRIMHRSHVGDNRVGFADRVAALVATNECAFAQVVGWSLSRDPHLVFACGGKTFSTKMAKSQLKSTRFAPGCGHPIFDWDTHNHCFPCHKNWTDQSSVHETASFSSKKRDRSPFPHEEVDDDPSYRETLVAI